MINPVVLTYSTEMPERLRVSAERNGWPFEVMLDKDGPYKGANHKFKQIIGSIERLKARGYTHLISVDAFDTVITGSRQHLLGQLHSMNWPTLVIAAETNCFPDKTLEAYFPNAKTRWKYVNSPFILDLRQPIPDGFADIGGLDDQVHITQWWLQNKDREGVLLDTECRFFQTLYGVSQHLFQKDLQNTETGTYPIFFHGNGRANMDWLPGVNKVVIGVATAGFIRDSSFVEELVSLHKPTGTEIVFVHGQSPAQARNMAIRRAAQINATHILFIDDDIKPPKDGLQRLLSHNKDVVTGLYLMKKWPHQPVIFDGSDVPGNVRWHMLEDGEQGLIPIKNCGFGFVLIKTEVLKKLKDPWVTLGDPSPESWCDDVPFFNKIVAAGYEMFCDLDIRCGHSGMITFWPTNEHGKWFTTLDTVSPKTISTPQLNWNDYAKEVSELQEIQAKLNSGLIEV
jgi:hypothetical protein